MEPVVFGLHTAEVKRWITHKEANAVKAFFGVKPDEPLLEQSQFYTKGLTKIGIKEVEGKKPRFYIHAKINFARATGYGDYRIMPCTTVNIRKAITAFNKVLRLLPLSPENAVFADWTVERLDSAFDVRVENTELFMSRLNRSVNLHNRRKKCRRVEIKDDESHSMRFKCNSFAYNIYIKLIEAISKGKSLSEKDKDEIRFLIRAERQNYRDAVKKLLPSRSIKDLLNKNTHDNILKTMIDEIEIFFGRGDYYSWKGICKNYIDHGEEIGIIKEPMVKITKSSLESEYDTYEQVSDIFERLKIAPVGIPKDLGISFMQGLYNRLTEAYPRPKDKRQYNNFPVPHMGADGRYRATVTLYWSKREKQKLSIAGKTLADYEMKVSRKLREVCLINRFSKRTNPEAYDKSFDSIVRFQKTVKTKEVKQEIDSFIKAFEMSDANKNMPEQEK